MDIELHLLVEALKEKGHGVGWNTTEDKYWPYTSEGGCLNWWYNPEGCQSTDFMLCVRLTCLNLGIPTE